MIDCRVSNAVYVSYDAESDNGNDKFEGITNLVEHPIQMKPPGKFSIILLTICYTPCPRKKLCKIIFV